MGLPNADNGERDQCLKGNLDKRMLRSFEDGQKDVWKDPWITDSKPNWPYVFKLSAARPNI